MSEPLLLNQPVVIDNGSYSIKAGFAGSSKPKVVVPTKVGHTKHMRIMPGGALEQPQADALFVGTKLDEHRGAFLLEQPMQHGVIGNWNAMEQLWDHAVYGKQHLNATATQHPVLVTEAPRNPRRHREQMAQIFFESMNVPALYFATPSVLSLYASGRTTGVVLDVGHGVAHAVPVYQGFALPHSVVRSNIAGSAVTQLLQKELRQGTGLDLTTTAEADWVNELKHEVAYLGPPTATPATYALPDGQVVELQHERCKPPNVLFDPSLVGSEEPGCHQLLLNAIQKSDLELRPKLWQQIVLAGGSTLLPGFGDRLLAEGKRATSAAIRIHAPPERAESAYVGGSILASLATFKNMWVGKADYEEHGARILHRREI